jgi:hypothetical protein
LAALDLFVTIWVIYQIRTVTVKTQMNTTISSIADAAKLLRVGGILSITTFPRSNENEDYAVHALLEGVALLSSKSIDWRAYVEDLGPDPDNPKEYSVRDTVQTAMERITMDLGNKLGG